MTSFEICHLKVDLICYCIQLFFAVTHIFIQMIIIIQLLRHAKQLGDRGQDAVQIYNIVFLYFSLHIVKWLLTKTDTLYNVFNLYIYFILRFIPKIYLEDLHEWNGSSYIQQQLLCGQIKSPTTSSSTVPYLAVRRNAGGRGQLLTIDVSGQRLPLQFSFSYELSGTSCERISDHNKIW